MESDTRLYGTEYDALLKEAADSDTALDPQALLEAALGIHSAGPAIKLVIGAVDPQTGMFVGYRMPLEPDPYIPPLLRIVGIATADDAGTIFWRVRAAWLLSAASCATLGGA